MKKPLVSIWMLTYNHEAYIGQAIESVIMQKTEFPYILHIGEDCSTDKTRNICIDYKNKYPHQIDLHLNDKNDILKNAETIYNACFRSGAKYIAMLEGDDYWIDPYKLQKQIDFLESHSDYSLCFHNSNITYENKKIKDKLFCNESTLNTVKTEDLIRSFYIPTASMVFRKSSLDLPEWFRYIYNGDYALALILSLSGNLKYIDEVMSVYRKNSHGLNARIKNSFVWFKIYELLSYFDYYSDFQFHKEIQLKKNELRDQVNISLSSEKTRLEKALSFEFWKRKLSKYPPS